MTSLVQVQHKVVADATGVVETAKCCIDKCGNSDACYSQCFEEKCADEVLSAEDDIFQKVAYVLTHGSLLSQDVDLTTLLSLFV